MNSAAIILGCLLTLAFAPFSIYPLGIIAPAGLLFLWLHKSPWQAFKLGFLFGLGLFGSGIYWVYHSLYVFGGVPLTLAFIMTGALVMLMALYPAFTGYFTNRYFSYHFSSRLFLALPAIWVLSEWLRSFILGGFPWLFVGYTQTSSPLAGFAPLGSVYLVSFATLISSALLVSIFLSYREKKYRALYLQLFTLTCIWIAGALLCLIAWTKPIAPPLKISLVQGNIPQQLKWDPEHLKLSIKRYTTLSEPLWGKSDLIVWPEGAIPLSLQDAAPLIEKLDERARNSHTALILGIPIEASDHTNYYNGLIMLGQNKALYVKRILVQFGEYVPSLPFAHFFMSWMNIPMSKMIPGKLSQDPFKVGNLLISPTICSEITYPELVRITNPSLGFLLTASNDAWFGTSSASAQHLQMARMRAIELRHPLLFVGNDGITAIVDATGQVESVAPSKKPYVLQGKVQAFNGLTPWMRFGIDPVLLLIVVLIIQAVRFNKRAQKKMMAHSNLPSMPPLQKAERESNETSI